jgi:hypothetical protein
MICQYPAIALVEWTKILQPDLLDWAKLALSTNSTGETILR